MVTLSRKGAFAFRGRLIIEEADRLGTEEINKRLAAAGLAPTSDRQITRETARTGTIAHQILTSHNRSGDERNLQLRFDSLASHDITYVGIILTARASGMTEFPVPYVLTNCHNSLCAVGGTINEDDHVFGLSAARKYGGIYVPSHLAVIHQYVREMMAGCGKMILASDSHTRYGALGTMGIGEGGPEIVKQLLSRTYEITYPEVVAVYLKAQPAPGVGPQDVALALIKAVFPSGFVKNKILEFIGPGVTALPVDFRNGIDVMTTETTCLSSIWQTDEQVESWYRIHGRPEEYRRLSPEEVCWYDGIVEVDLSRVEPMIALPFHPSNAWSIAELNRNAVDILRTVESEGKKQVENPNLELRLTEKLVGGRLKVEQGAVVGCAGGTFDNISAMAEIMAGGSIGDGAFNLSVYPASQPVFLELIRNRSIEKLMSAGTVIKTAFCGPCFGAGDTPANNGLSIRHATRNFPNREGSKPSNGQLASVALMDARSIAATALNGGLLTPATEVDAPPLTQSATYRFDKQVYDRRVYQGYGRACLGEQLHFAPNIIDWPKIAPLPENLLLKVASVIHDPVTTTDELIPSGETSSYRSNPLKLAEYTLSRKDPGYVARAKAFQKLENRRRTLLIEGGSAGELLDDLPSSLTNGKRTMEEWQHMINETGLATVIFAVKPGDGSAREQAASCQKVLGGEANVAVEYATKRYRSNLINWGMLPFTIARESIGHLHVDDLILIEGIRKAITNGEDQIPAMLIHDGKQMPLELRLEGLTREDREIILAGCLMNYYAK
jgi:aconitate hydratase